MGQGLFGGMTSYEDQSLKDIQEDINKWQAYTIRVQRFYKETIETLTNNRYLHDTVDFDVKTLF